MSLLSDLKTLLTPVGVPIEAGIFSDKAPDQYLVLVPLVDTFDMQADNKPGVDVQEVRLSLYSKGSYTAKKNAIVRALLSSDITITARQYIGFDAESGYHHYNIDVADYYEMEEN